MELLLFSTLQSLGIDIRIVFLVICAGYIQKTFIKRRLCYSISLSAERAVRTLVLSSGLVLVHGAIVVSTGQDVKEFAQQWFVSYCFAVTFYHVFMKAFMDARRDKDCTYN